MEQDRKWGNSGGGEAEKRERERRQTRAQGREERGGWGWCWGFMLPIERAGWSRTPGPLEHRNGLHEGHRREKSWPCIVTWV